MAIPDGRYPDAIADLLARENLPPPYLRIHDEDLGALYLVRSPQAKAWAEDPEHAGRPVHLLVWLGVFPPVEGAVLEVHSFDAATSDDEEELARWLFDGGDTGEGAEPTGRIDPRMRAMLMFQEAQMMGARTTESRTPKYNPLRSLKLQVGSDTRAKYRSFCSDFASVWGDARRQLVQALEPSGQATLAYSGRLTRVVVEPDLIQFECGMETGTALFTLGSDGPHLHDLS